MSFCEGTEPFRKVYEWRALSRIGSAETNDGNLHKPTPVCFEDGVDECGSTDADGGDLGRRYGGKVEYLADRILYTRRDIGGGGGLVMCEHPTARVVKTCDVDQDTIGVGSCN